MQKYRCLLLMLGFILVSTFSTDVEALQQTKQDQKSDGDNNQLTAIVIALVSAPFQFSQLSVPKTVLRN